MLAQLKILHKHLLAFGCVILCLLVPTFYALWQLESTKKQVDNIHQNWLPSVALISSINMMTSDFRIEELQHASTTSEQEMRFCEERMSSLAKKIEESQRQYKKLIIYDEEKEQFSRFERLWEKYLLLNQQFLRLSGENKNAEAVQVLDKQAWQTFQQFSEMLNKLVEINEKGSLEATQKAEEILQDTRQYTFIWIGITVLVALMMVIWLVRQIVLPIGQLQKRATLLAEGSVKLAPLPIISQDEIGLLAESFEQMASKITDNQWLMNQQKRFYETVNLQTAPTEWAQRFLQLMTEEIGFWAGTYYELQGSELLLKNQYAVQHPIPSLKIGEGWTGQIALKGGWHCVSSATPKSSTGTLSVLSPAEVFMWAYWAEGAIKGVFEIASGQAFSPIQLNFLQYIAQRMEKRVG